MKYLYVLLGAVVALGCNPSQEGAPSVDPLEQERDAHEEGVDQAPTGDRYERMMESTDSYIDQLESTGGFTATQLKKGNSAQFIEFITYFVDGEIVKLESYLFSGKDRVSERFYFKDKRLVRADRFNEAHSPAPGEERSREERHYFDGAEALSRSVYRASEGDHEELGTKPFVPLVDQDRELQQHILIEKMMKYTSEVGANASDLDLHADPVEWPIRLWDMDEIRQDVIQEIRSQN